MVPVLAPLTGPSRPPAPPWAAPLGPGRPGPGSQTAPHRCPAGTPPWWRWRRSSSTSPSGQRRTDRAGTCSPSPRPRPTLTGTGSARPPPSARLRTDGTIEQIRSWKSQSDSIQNVCWSWLNPARWPVGPQPDLDQLSSDKLPQRLFWVAVFTWQTRLNEDLQNHDSPGPVHEDLRDTQRLFWSRLHPSCDCSHASSCLTQQNFPLTSPELVYMFTQECKPQYQLLCIINFFKKRLQMCEKCHVFIYCLKEKQQSGVWRRVFLFFWTDL